ncbi:MAG: TonB-dependent receptor [Candidatus Cloacimonadota bacterium]|nr:MAG: TonB-dependent receptor [Candidatus Cloacimonadota bacterium]
MKDKRFLKIPFVTALLLIFSISIAFAGVTGKISGRITDASTGEPLPGVNVVIDGTSMGGAANVNGQYFILNVPVGTFSLTATMIGYKSMTKTGVRVIQDFTTTLGFELEQTIVEVEGITIIAKKPMVKKDVTSTTHFITTEEIERGITHNYNDIISEQAGVILSEGGASTLTGGLHIRGGRGDEIAYMVDGMSINDALTGQAGAQVNMNAIQEVVVQTGGFNAEYGQAMSGIVNLVTKEGRKQEGFLRYTTDYPFKKDTAYYENGYKVGPEGGNLYEGFHRAELNLGGPAPGVKGLTYFLSSELTSREHENSYYFPLSNSDREYYSLNGKLSYELTPTMKIKVSGFSTRTQYGEYCGTYGLPGEGQWCEQDDKYKPPLERTAVLIKAQQGHLAFNQVLNKSTFYEVNFAYFSTHRWEGTRDAVFEKDRSLWEDMEFLDWWNYDINEATSPGVRPDSIDSLDFYVKDENGNYYYPWGVGGQSGNNFAFGNSGSGSWTERLSSYINGKFDITSQITNHHQLKVGMEGIKHKAARHTGRYIANTISEEARRTHDLSKCLYFDDYEYEPLQAALYVQDKMEYPGFIVNIGLRGDYLDANAQKYIDPTRILEGKEDAKPKYKVSPRLGVSFPVTEKTVLHVSYGQFFQIPRLIRLYDNAETNIATATGGWTRIGNPDLSAQQTTAYEFGIAHELTPDAALFITLYYKDLYDLIGVRFVPALPNTYTQFVTEDYGNVKGAEFTFSKRATEYLSGKLVYTLSQAKGTGSYSTQAYYDYIANVPIDPVTDKPVPMPKSDYALEFDQRHLISAEVNFRVPNKTGPMLGTIYPLHNLNINVLTSIGSGLPYTKRNTSQLIIGEVNGERMPWTWATDLKIRKGFKQWNLNYALFAEITNLFNIRNILNVYPETGKTDDNDKLSTFDGYMSSTWPPDVEDVIPSDHSKYDERRDFDGNGQITQQEWYDSYKMAYQDLLNSPYLYGEPRKIQVGISVNF